MKQAVIIMKIPIKKLTDSPRANIAKQIRRVTSSTRVMRKFLKRTAKERMSPFLIICDSFKSKETAIVKT